MLFIKQIKHSDKCLRVYRLFSQLCRILYVSALGHCLKFTLGLFLRKVNLFHPSVDLRHQRAIWWFDCLLIKIRLLGSWLPLMQRKLSCLPQSTKAEKLRTVRCVKVKFKYTEFYKTILPLICKTKQSRKHWWCVFSLIYLFYKIRSGIKFHRSHPMI